MTPVLTGFMWRLFCRHCHRHWLFDVAPDRFCWIGRLCPDCIGKTGNYV